MASQTLTVALPDVIYSRLKQRAQQANRTVEAELLEVLANAVPTGDELPTDLAEAIAPLALLDEEGLRRTAASCLPADSAAQLEELHLKRQREGLTESEAETLSGLIRQYEQAMLVRARAAMLLKQRGHDVSGFSAS